MSDHANQRRIIKASPQKCFDMVSDVEKLSEWTTDIKEVKVLVRRCFVSCCCDGKKHEIHTKVQLRFKST